MKARVFIVAASLVGAPLTAALASPQAGQAGQETTATQQRAAERQDQGTQRGLVASDAITGINVRDQQGENLGTIDRLILNHETGDIEHVIIARGGVLGVGRDHVQLSWDDIELMRDDQDIVARADANKVRQAQNVDRDWADQAWETDRTVTGQDQTRTDRDQPRTGQDAARDPDARTEPGIGRDQDRDPDARPAPTTGAAAPTTGAAATRVGDRSLIAEDKIVNSQVRDPQGREIGRVERLMLDPQDGKAKYAVIGVGGFLGIGRDHLLVPFDDVRVALIDNNVTVSMDQQVIDQAPRAWLGDDDRDDVRTPDTRTEPGTRPGTQPGADDRQTPQTPQR